MSGTTRGRRVHLANGHEFPNWTVESHLADGGLSSVYRARYTGLRVNEFPAVAALKITSLQPADLDRLVEEYENARQFSGHPQVVQVHDVFETETTEYGRCVVLVHELGEESLKDHLAKHGSLTRLEAQRLAYNLASGIAALHEAKIIHSDIKPANILSFPTGWKVADLAPQRSSTPSQPQPI
jgi:serine/threonine-protein kinase